ncbi:MAG TPA: hypothetical protein VKM55_30920 [Candidatus Lokiarchaeia archaeon]|nr:hypothetical protein [Candidatus Lokiarchaeia archaeon]
MSSNGVKMVKAISASKLAALATSEPNGSAENQEFGKKVEQAIEKVSWKYDVDEFSEQMITHLDQCEKCKKDCLNINNASDEDEDWEQCDEVISIYERNGKFNDFKDYFSASEALDFISSCVAHVVEPDLKSINHERAETIAREFFKAGLRGNTPKKQWREINEHRIYAKPDLRAGLWWNDYYEFKIYPISDYARMQSAIFAWVLDENVTLLGFKDGHAEKEIIKPLTDEEMLDLITRFDSEFDDEKDEEESSVHDSYIDYENDLDEYDEMDKGPWPWT